MTAASAIESDGIPPQIGWVTEVIPCNLWIVR